MGAGRREAVWGDTQNASPAGLYLVKKVTLHLDVERLAVVVLLGERRRRQLGGACFGVAERLGHVLVEGLERKGAENKGRGGRRGEREDGREAREKEAQWQQPSQRPKRTLRLTSSVSAAIASYFELEPSLGRPMAVSVMRTVSSYGGRGGGRELRGQRTVSARSAERGQVHTSSTEIRRSSAMSLIRRVVALICWRWRGRQSGGCERGGAGRAVASRRRPDEPHRRST